VSRNNWQKKTLDCLPFPTDNVNYSSWRRGESKPRARTSSTVRGVTLLHYVYIEVHYEGNERY